MEAILTTSSESRLSNVTEVAPRGSTRRRWATFLVPFLIFATLGTSWLVATPLMGVPDEPAQVIRAAAVARGNVDAVVGADEQPRVMVPRFVARAYSLTCFAYNSSLSAACQPGEVRDPDEIVLAVTTADSNSPVYYALIGWPSLLIHNDAAFYAMRAMNVLLCSLLVGLTFLALGDLRRHRWAMVGAAVAVTPQALFLTGGVNPNSVEVTAAMALLATLVVTLRRTTPSTRLAIERSGAILVSAALVASTRSIALLWVVIIVVAALALSRPAALRGVLRRPPFIVTIGATAAVGVASVLWYATSQRVNVDPTNDGSGQSFAWGFLTMLQRTFDYWSGWTAIFGWLDLPAPSVTYVIWYTLTLGLLVSAFLFSRGRPRWVLAGLALALVLVPAIVQGTLVGAVGIIWQGRYNLALFAIVLLVAGIALDTAIRAGRPIRRVVTTIAVLIAVAQLAAFTWALRRSSVGDGTLIQMVKGPEWQPFLGVVPTLLLASLALAAAVVVISRTLGRPPGLPASLATSKSPAG